jgi:transposase
MGVGTVSECLARARAAGVDWATAEALDDDALEARLYPSKSGTSRPLPDPAYVDKELRRPGVTLKLLHEEYLAQHPDGYGYTQFCEAYCEWRRQQRLTMRQVHRAGDKLFVDYAGKRPSIVDPKTGERTEVELFVAVLGASSYTYAEATLTQRVPDFIASHVRALEFFGGVPAALVHDQLESAVTRADRYEPALQRSFEELARHYGTTVLPARHEC